MIPGQVSIVALGLIGKEFNTVAFVKKLLGLVTLIDTGTLDPGFTLRNRDHTDS
jgi:hypothetical protein